MSKDFIPADYVDVATRIHRFYERHPEGRIVTRMATWNEDGIVFEALVYRDREQDTARPDATGWAHEVPGQGHVNRTSAVENCETSAIGRALANLGFVVKDGEPRPSRQEMAKAQRANSGNGNGNGGSRERPATEKQLRMIDRLVLERAIDAEPLAQFQRRLSRGLTAAEASHAIDWLSSLPAETAGAASS